tara:strand:- start:412 stop:801 length:390 start_codon:yes stop_codon:yes gene_type:complete
VIDAAQIAQMIGGRKIGKGKYRGKCPVCVKDHFYVSDGDKWTMMFCHAGASFKELCDALGIKQTDCAPGDYTPPPYNPNNDIEVVALAAVDLRKRKELSESDINFVNKAKARLQKNKQWRRAVEFAKSC